ncbi:MAG: ATP-binding protein [Thiotrichales bacterium]|nr:ATP-binding protein [Thiotrichales bacterium]
MTEISERIPFAVDIGRMIEVLAAQIYPTPFALLRENVQNSFDAILQRQYLNDDFAARIDVDIEPGQVRVTDNGIGMSRKDLRNHFWRAGSSSKNNEDARAAGVVGTFGIGAMANFGIAEELHVETEDMRARERTACSAFRSTLSVTEDCISFDPKSSTGSPGTMVTAIMQPDKLIRVDEARAYISQFVAYLPIDVFVNGSKASGFPIEESVPALAARTWTVEAQDMDLGNGVKGDVDLVGSVNGEVRIALRNVEVDSQELTGHMVLRQGVGNLRTFRSGFGLATTSINSVYGFGGVADFLFLQPTAGREALTTESMLILQRLASGVEEFVSLQLAERPESNASAPFVAWAAKRRRFNLCSNLRVRMEPGDSLPLHEIRKQSRKAPVLVYLGTDRATVEHASEDRPIVIPTRGSPRRDCEVQYLRKYCKIEVLSDDPQVLEEKSNMETSVAEKALAFRLGSILSNDYFLESHIKFGQISHELPVLVTRRKTPVEIFLDPKGGTIRLILDLYENQFSAFGHMVKDFVRNMIFPRVSDLVPTATRQGAEAFLKSIHRVRDVFEYEASDLESLAALWKDYMNGRLSFQQAAERSNRVATRSYQTVDSTAAGSVRDVVPDVIDNQSATEQSAELKYGPMPPIQRLDMETEKKLLTIELAEPSLKNYRCFLALTDRVREENGDFFLQPHRTSIVWGGQKALFIFQHHSGEFGLYYDLQTRNLISDESGGGSMISCTIVMKNRIFIPIPTSIQARFLPKEGEKKRFEVKCDILYIDRQSRGSS